MKILHLNTHDVSGGAARAAYRLHHGLLQLGQDSKLLVEQRACREPEVIAFQRPADFSARLRRRLRRELIARSYAPYLKTRPPGAEYFSDPRSEYELSLVQQLPPCDVINLHWIARFVDLRAFFAAVAPRLPVVWTLHDMNPFTGGCHYDRGCGKFEARCGACPMLGSQHDDDLSRRHWQRKRAAYGLADSARLHFVAPSRWIAGEAQRSSLIGRFPITVIPNGVNTDDFAPRDRQTARAALEIPPDARVLLFVADDVVERRKGFGLLVEALHGLADLPDLFLLSMGSPQPILELPFPHRHLGRLEYDPLIALVFNAADVFVLPSLQDNLPNTMLEALACGTPVVGFATGGIPDAVDSGVTGLLAPPGDVAALRAALRRLLEDPALRSAISAEGRRRALEHYALDVQARHYLTLYSTLVDAVQQDSTRS